MDISVNDFQKIYEFMQKKEVDRNIHISVKNSYIYFETPKVACTTIKKKLQEIEARMEGVILPENRHPSDIHKKKKSPLLSPCDIGFEKFCAMLNDEAVVKFCFVRNPYTRTLSAFLNKIDLPKKTTPKKQIINHILGLDVDVKITFKQFLYAISKTTPFDMDPHWRPQTNQLFWGCINYNFIGYFENFTEEFDEVLRKIYPRFINENSWFDVQSNPRNKTNASFKMIEFYDNENRDLVREIYQEDIRNFNYPETLFTTVNMPDMSNDKQSKQGIEIDCKQPFYVYKNLGDALAKQKQFGEAIAAYQKVIELESKNSVVYCAIGRCYNQSNNYQKAILNYQKAIALESNQPAWVYKNLGNALAKQKQLDEAISNYEKAIKIKSEDALAQVSLGHLYLQNRQPDKAFNCYLKAVQLRPNVKTSYGKLGYFHGGHAELNFNQLDKAIECYRKAIDKQPKFFLPYVYLGDSLTAKNELDQAISYYQKAGEKKLLEKYPELAESQDGLDKVEKPNFIIIGAGKSGTSSLYEYICSHPQIISSLKKELRFFNYKPNFHKGVDWYLSHFPPIPQGKNLITGEATPGYFGSDVQESIYSLFPNIKLIAIVRNPVDRAFSQYNHWVRNGIERRSFQEAVTSEIEKLESFLNSIDILELKKTEKIKEICRQVRKGNSKEKTCYLWEGLYVYFLQKWTNYFSKEQLLVLASEDFYAQPEVEMKKVNSFLGLPDYRLTQYKKYNAGKYSSIDEKLYGRISEFFQPHNQRLEEYLNRKFNWS